MTAPPLFPYEEIRLDNGLRLVTLEDHRAPVVAVHLWYHVGSKNEASDRRGFAHMFEHMMFRGSDRLGPEGHFDCIRRTGGEANAHTGFDQTVFVQEVPANQLELVLWLEAERMAFLRIDARGFETEREVVAEELQRIAEAPYGTVPERLLPRLFPGHPYSWTPGGCIDDLRRARAAELQIFWERYYVPGNATLIIVGDVDSRRVEELTRRYFGWIPSMPVPPPPARPTTPRTSLDIRLRELNGPAPVVAFGFPGVPAGHADALPLALAAGILGGGESSRLYRGLVTERRIAVMAMAQSVSLEDAGFVGAAAVLPPLVGRRRKTLRMLQEELERFAHEGPTDAELVKAKNHALRETVVARLSVADQAQTLGHHAVVEGDLPALNARFDRIRALGVEDLREATARAFGRGRAIRVSVRPSLIAFLTKRWRRARRDHDGGASPSESAAGPTATSDSVGKPGLRRPPDLPEQPPIAPPLDRPPQPPLTERRLSNGLPLVVVTDHSVPFVTCLLGCFHGAFAEDLPGTATCAASLVLHGTENYDERRLTDELGDHAISLVPRVEMDYSMIEVEAVTEHAPRAVALLGEVTRRPTFPPGALHTLRRQLRTARRIEERDPGRRADRELRLRLFGRHPYARTAEGESRDLARIAPETVRAWWSRFVRPDACVLYVCGDLDADHAQTLAEEALGNWRAPVAVPPTPLPPFPDPVESRIVLVDRPGEQVQIRLGHRSIDRHHPRFFDAIVLNQVFGGGFNSRLNRALRIERGLTYGVSGGISVGRFGGEFSVSTFSRVASAPEAIEVVLDEVDRLMREPPTEEEVETAKTFLAGNFLLGRQTPLSIIEDQWLLTYSGLPADYLDRYLHGIARCRAEDLGSLAAELLRPERFTIVVVGPAKSLRSRLAHIAPVTLAGER